MKIDQSIFHPEYKREPYWWEAARPGTQYSTDLPTSTEVLIVGSGYAGLSAALELAREGRTATVVDAMAFGEGASSRSGGGVSAGINIGKGLSGGPGQQTLSDAHQNTIIGLMSESLAAFEFVQTLIEREAIECHYERHGRFVGAFSKAHYPGLVKKAEFLNQHIDLDASVIPYEEQRSEIGSDFYHGGMVIKRAGKLHPSLFHKGLLDACNRSGVTLCAHTKVEAITGADHNFKIETSRGICRAEHVIIATNGYTGALTPKLRNRIVPISSQIIVTEELPEDLARELIPNGRTISETPRITSYYRMLPGERRVMYGGRARFHDVPPDVSATLLYRMMTDRWPQLKGTRITHSWSGFVAMTTDALPHMGEVDGLHFCTGCNGSGVAMMPYLGRQVARRILQGGQTDCAYGKIDFPGVPVPLYRGHPWFLPVVGEYYRYLDRRDRRNNT
ncbi:MAG: glycine/D-amino acid oxidase-like deaminating enzyme [Hyphomicrobiaceae bacterium]|jgi:glycine/D-amino acid oxidase-like deaminating enzyme